MKSVLIIFLSFIFLGNYVFVFSIGLKNKQNGNKIPVIEENKVFGNCFVKMNNIIFDLNPISQYIILIKNK